VGLLIAFEICAQPTQHPDEFGNLFLLGREVSEKQAAEYESRLQEKPDDTLLRCRLASYYWHAGIGRQDSGLADKRVKHVLWIVKHFPDSDAAGSSELGFHRDIDLDAYLSVSRVWHESVEQYPEDPDVLENAAGFYWLDQPVKAKSLFERAVDLDPENPDRLDALAHFYELKEEFGPGLEAVLGLREKAIELSGDRRSRFLRIGNAANAALRARNFEKASIYAEQLLASATVGGGWNRGNAIYEGNSILGLAALQEGDQRAAVKRLRAAGRCGGSPQLNSFGPDFDLAQALLDLGEHEAVVAFLQDCQSFWERDRGALGRWIEEIEAGRSPTLDRFGEWRNRD